MTPPLKSITARVTLAILTSVLPAATQAQQPTPRTFILVDPAHGGPDTGAHLGDDLLEKDFNLAFAGRLRALLSAAGFSIISTRESDPAAPFTTDQRAEIANHSHPAACLILHATSSGSGIHIVTSALPPPDDFSDPDAAHNAVPWDTAQTASIPQSLRLANDLGLAIVHAKLPVILTRASIRPLDNLTCPAAVIEIAPLIHPGSDPTPITDANYQQQVAQAIASALTTWRSHAVPSGATR